MVSNVRSAISLASIAVAMFFSVTTVRAESAPTNLDEVIKADFAKPELRVNEALIVQTGDTNIALFDQESTIIGKGNMFEASQSGAHNEVNVIQIGDSNRARIDQNGNYNVAETRQMGSSNLVDLVQSGNGNRFVAVQNGNDNRILAMQNSTR